MEKNKKIINVGSMFIPDYSVIVEWPLYLSATPNFGLLDWFYKSNNPARNDQKTHPADNIYFGMKDYNPKKILVRNI